MIWCVECLRPIIDYFRRPVYYQIDILLLGFKDAGKTSLVHALSETEIRSNTVPTLKTKVSSIRLSSHQIIDTQPTAISAAASPNINITSASTIHSKSTLTGPSNGSIRSYRTSNRFNAGLNEHSPLLEQEPDSQYSQQQQEEEEARGSSSIVLKIYDLSGQHKNRHVWKDMIANLDGKHSSPNLIIYMIDLSDYLNLNETRLKVIELLKLNNEHHKIPFMILFNKNDLVHDREIKWIQEETRKRHQLEYQNNQIHNDNDNENENSVANIKKDNHSIHHRPHTHKRISSRHLQLLSPNSNRHDLLMNYLGISKTPSNSTFQLDDDEDELLFDLGLFVVSLKDPDQQTSLHAVVDWIVAC